MSSSDLIFLAIAIPLVVMFTAWRIWVMRRGARLYREIAEALEKRQQEQK